MRIWSAATSSLSGAVRAAVPGALVLLLLGACAMMPKLAAGPVTVRGVMTVTSDGGWNRLEAGIPGPGETWTSDGLALDALTFYVGIREGGTLVRNPGGTRPPPAFRASMLPTEIAEFFEAGVTGDGSTFKLERLQPVQFAGSPGFRFDFTVVRKNDDVTLRGFAHGAVVKDRLYLIVFRAPRIHYYAKHLPRAEAAARSAQLKL